MNLEYDKTDGPGPVKVYEGETDWPVADVACPSSKLL